MRNELIHKDRNLSNLYMQLEYQWFQQKLEKAVEEYLEHKLKTTCLLRWVPKNSVAQ